MLVEFYSLIIQVVIFQLNETVSRPAEFGPGILWLYLLPKAEASSVIYLIIDISSASV